MGSGGRGSGRFDRRAWYFGDREYSGRVRDGENRTVVGGMRRPVEILARVLGLRAAGLHLRHGLERFTDLHPEGSLTSILKFSSSIPGQGFEDPLVATVARSLHVPDELAICRGPHSVWRPHLVHAFIDQASDPEEHLAGWLRDVAPIGVDKPIPESGIFPSTTTKAPGTDLVTSLYAWTGGHTNYVSVTENQPAVEAELHRLVNKGKIIKFDSWADLLGWKSTKALLCPSWH